jgi:hypothetical protein
VFSSAPAVNILLIDLLTNDEHKKKKGKAASVLRRLKHSCQR